MRRSARRFWAFIALGVAGGLLIVADATLYLDREILEADSFSERAASSLDEPEVRRVVAEEISTRIGAQSGVSGEAADRVILRAVATDQFRALFAQAAREVHGVAFVPEDERGQVQLVVRNLGPLLQEQAAVVDPQLSGFVPANLDVPVASVSEQVDGAIGDIARFSEDSQLLARLTLVFGLLLLAASVLLHPERRIGISRAGLLLVGIGLISIVLTVVGKAAAVEFVDEPGVRDAAGSVWDAYFGDFRTFNIVLAITGAIIALAAAVYPQAQSARRPRQRGWQTGY